MRGFTSGRHIFFVCITTIFGFGIFSAANLSTKYLSTSYWLALCACVALSLVPTVIFSVLSRRYNKKTLYDYSPMLLGRVGHLLSLAFALFYLIFAGLVISYYSHVVAMWILPNTDFRIVCAVIVLICLYSIVRGFEGTLSLCSLLGAFAVITVIFIRILMLFSGDLSNILPFFDEITAKNGLKNSLFECFPFFLGCGTLAIMPCHERSKSNVIWAVLGVSVSGALLILVCSACIAMIGPLQTGLYTDAMVLAMKAFDISHITFIQRADIIFIITWSMLILSSSCCFIHIPYLYAKKLVGNGRSRLAGVVVCTITFCISLIPHDMDSALALIGSVGNSFGIFAVFAVPIVMLISSEVLRHAEK